MASSDQDEILELGSEAARLLDDLQGPTSVDQEISVNSRRNQASKDAARVSSQGEFNTASTSQSLADFAPLFLGAVSLLKSQGRLVPGRARPSMQNSRVTTTAYVVCDSKGKVIGRVPLDALREYLPKQKTVSAQKRVSNEVDQDGEHKTAKPIPPQAKSTASGTNSYIHPETGRTVRPNMAMVFTGALFFGPIFFFFVEEPGHGIIHFIASVVLAAASLNLVVLFLYALAAPGIIRKKWISRGYVELD